MYPACFDKRIFRGFGDASYIRIQYTYMDGEGSSSARFSVDGINSSEVLATRQLSLIRSEDVGRETNASGVCKRGNRSC